MFNKDYFIGLGTLFVCIWLLNYFTGTSYIGNSIKSCIIIFLCYTLGKFIVYKLKDKF